MTVSELATPETRLPLGFTPKPAPAITHNTADSRPAAREAPDESTRRSPSPIPMGEGNLSPSPIPTDFDELRRNEGSPPPSSSEAPASPAPIPSAPSRLSDEDRFPFYSAAQLNSGQFDTRYLIPGVLTAAQPGGIFGAFKTLKTSITADLLISLASGTPFLGHFPVAEPGRTLFLSGESGLAALQSIARRICAGRGLALETLDNFELCRKLPNLDNAEDVRALGRIVHKKRPVCVAIDPAYLAIRGEDARNLFAMGALLRPLAEICDDTGCTILIVHHCKRSRVRPGDPATLDDVAWTGFAEFAAQWLLLARRRRYDPETGRHEIWFTTGGRAGHHELCALDVDERSADDAGTTGESRGEGRLASASTTKRGCRIWQTKIRRTSSAETQSDKRVIEASEDRRKRRSALVLDRDRRRLLKQMYEMGVPVTARRLRDILGINGLRIRHILCSLMRDELVTERTYQDGYRTVTGYTVNERVIAIVEREAGEAEATPQSTDHNLATGSGHIVSQGN